MASKALCGVAATSIAAIVKLHSTQRCATMEESTDASLRPTILDNPGGALLHLEAIPHLSDLGFKSAGVPNEVRDTTRKSAQGQEYNKIIREEDCVLLDIVRTGGRDKEMHALPRAGPRPTLHFKPTEVRAAIVTCGGLCPGLNDVIHHIVNTLSKNYSVDTIYGIRGGYRGLARGKERIHTEKEEVGMLGWLFNLVGYDIRKVKQASTDHFRPVVLNPSNVRTIHHLGGTILGSSRGGFDLDKIIEFLQTNRINQLYVVGGDGTHRGAFRISQACIERGLNIAVAGIPKTIDNDIAVIDNSFGFQSAVEAAQMAIRTAKTEASCNMPNGVGVVKLMGRSAGFIAAHATLASGDVNLCLIPEVPLVLHGEQGCLPHIESVIERQGHAVIVVAEGAGENLLGESAEVDAGGNRKLPHIGEFLLTQLKDHFKSKDKPVTIKYIDPSYIIRSVPANSRDSYECFVLAQGAVHGAMAGFTGFTVGMVNSHTAMIPIPLLVKDSPRTMNPKGRTWERVIVTTKQPNTCP